MKHGIIVTPYRARAFLEPIGMANVIVHGFQFIFVATFDPMIDESQFETLDFESLQFLNGGPSIDFYRRYTLF
tara:strand:- start:98 stop:316 length:219 start_codon:yes stop_codon:yes gene_type:complete